VKALLAMLVANNWCLLKYDDGTWMRADRHGIAQVRGYPVKPAIVQGLIEAGQVVQVFSRLLPDVEIWRPKEVIDRETQQTEARA
jgi:hypothetical protein